MELSDFQRRLLGFPAQALGNVASAFTADPNAPAEQQDMANARWGTLGQMGAILFAAGQPQTDQSRAAMLSRLAAVSTPDELAMNAAQRRLYGLKTQQAQTEMARQEALRQKFADPEFLKGINITPQMAEVMGQEGVADYIQKRALENTPDAIQRRRLIDAQIEQAQAQAKAALRPPAPEAGQVFERSDGTKAVLPHGSTTPISLEQASPISGMPSGADPKTYRQQITQDAVKKAALEQTRREDASKIFPDILRARQAYEKGQGYIGPAQSSSIYRGVQSALPFGMSHGEDVRSDIEAKLARYQRALVSQNLPPGAASDKDIELARSGMASIYDRSPSSGLASIDADLSSNLRSMGYNVPPPHISELIKDIRSNNSDGIRQFIEAHQGGADVVRMLAEGLQ